MRLPFQRISREVGAISHQSLPQMLDPGGCDLFPISCDNSLWSFSYLRSIECCLFTINHLCRCLSISKRLIILSLSFIMNRCKVWCDFITLYFPREENDAFSCIWSKLISCGFLNIFPRVELQRFWWVHNLTSFWQRFKLLLFF